MIPSMQKIYTLTLLGVLSFTGHLYAQSNGSTAKNCSVQHIGTPSAGDLAMTADKFAEAETAYRAEQQKTPTTEVSAKLVRSLIAQNKLDDALKTAQDTQQAHPQDSYAIMSLGEVHYRLSQMDQAATFFQRAAMLDTCNARAHADVADYMELIGLFASAEKQIDVAHRLSPDDRGIQAQWNAFNPAHLSAPERIAALQKTIETLPADDEQRKRTEQRIKRIDLEARGKCRLASPVETTTLPLPFFRFGHSSALDIEINGVKAHMILDTGASGILIGKALADKMKLEGELETGVGGIGDNGVQEAQIAVAKHLRIGNLTFEDCPVTITLPSKRRNDDVDPNSALSRGLIGADIFDQFLVTINIPERKLILSPLPPLPGKRDGNWDEEHPDDRYVAPSMTSWTNILRVGHDLIVPVQLNGKPPHLMIMDTGAETTTYSIAAAKEATPVTRSNQRMSGVSGDVKKVYDASRIILKFGGIQQLEDGMLAVDLTNLSESDGMEISGLIGYTVLRELTINIDYRDNLVQFIYDPTHGFHPGRYGILGE
jgi:tetratricopeptide (TPR) repeat protein